MKMIARALIRTCPTYHWGIPIALALAWGTCSAQPRDSTQLARHYMFIGFQVSDPLPAGIYYEGYEGYHGSLLTGINHSLYRELDKKPKLSLAVGWAREATKIELNTTYLWEGTPYWGHFGAAKLKMACARLDWTFIPLGTSGSWVKPFVGAGLDLTYRWLEIEGSSVAYQGGLYYWRSLERSITFCMNTRIGVELGRAEWARLELTMPMAGLLSGWISIHRDERNSHGETLQQDESYSYKESRNSVNVVAPVLGISFGVFFPLGHKQAPPG